MEIRLGANQPVRAIELLVAQYGTFDYRSTDWMAQQLVGAATVSADAVGLVFAAGND